MEGCVVSGLTQSIGVSNFNSEQLQRVLDNAHIKPAVIQVHVNNAIQFYIIFNYFKPNSSSATLT